MLSLSIVTGHSGAEFVGTAFKSKQRREINRRVFTFSLRKVVLTSVLERNPPCVGLGGYVRYNPFDEPNGQNLLA